jgi:hypothetical protein
MPLCTDPAITYLKSVGFSVVRLPRPDLQPLHIFGDDGRDLAPLGQLATLFRPRDEVALPAITTDQTGPAISGENASTLSVGIGIGIGILGTALAAMGAGKLDLKAAYKSASTVTFEFLHTAIDRAEIVAIDKYLGGSDVDPDARGTMLMLDANDVYVTTAIIKATELTITAKTSSGTEAGVDVPAIEHVVDGKIEVKADSKTSGRITYAGSVSLVFGFQAIRLYYDRGAYTAYEPVQSGTIAAKGLKPGTFPKGVQPLERAAPLVRLGES